MTTRSEIAALLPEVLSAADRPASPMRGLLEAMAGMVAPIDARLAEIDAIIDPHRCPLPMLGAILGWFGFGAVAEAVLARGADGDETERRLRALLLAAPWLTARRGTEMGLARTLQIACAAPEIALSPGAGPFEVIATLPDALSEAERSLAARILAVERPVFVSITLAPPASPSPPPNGP